jgi:4-amino-4-deoxy-L-arabinose transferase-like glycosyltransferase
MRDRSSAALDVRVPLVAALTGVVLLLVAGRYGYHRDELYFLQAGQHLSWGYPDQPPLVPFVARIVSAVAPGSLLALRLPSALIAASVVLLAGMIAQRLGAGRGGQVLAAASTAMSGVVLAMGHLLSTATLDLLGWTVVTYFIVRLLQGDDRRWWLVVGLVAGITMLANVLVAFLLAGFVVSVVLVGPRRLLLSRWPWGAAGIAVLLALPYVLWQAAHGWPQLEVAGNIAAGGSGTSTSRLLFLPLVVLQIGPWLLPLWLWGLVRLLRDTTLRSLGATFVVLLVVFWVTGGKPYYLAGLFPLLLAAGAQPFLDWAPWRWMAPALVVLSAPVLLIALPLLPVRSAGIVVPVNYDVGETIGWPQLVRQVGSAYQRLPPGTAILAGNYGEAGAIDRYGPALGLPRAFSGHNAYGEWGHPPGTAPVLAVGIDPALLRQSCQELRPSGRLVNPYGIDNDENGTLLFYCVPGRPWQELWPRFRHLG